MVELLVVVAVLALLIGLITAVAGKVLHQQKERNTRQIMQNTLLAIEQFAAENPLRHIYDRKDAASFGKFPPYQLAGFSLNGSVAVALEPNPPQGDYALANRLHRDLGQRVGDVSHWVMIDESDHANDDIRALGAYLRVYAPAAVATIPEAALKPIHPPNRDYVNPKGSGGTPGVDPDWVDVLGIHDAWGVPLDYMLYVKCEWRLAPGAASPTWVVTERKPVLRSLAIGRDVYEVWRTADNATKRNLSPPASWLFSEDLPRPWADVDQDGVFQSSSPQGNGWVRAVGLDEDYAYRPDGDASQP